MAKLGAVILQGAESREQHLKTKAATSRDTLVQLKSELQELIRMRARGLIDDEDFLVQRSAISERQNAVPAVPGRVRVTVDEIQAQLKRIIEPLHNLYATCNELVGSVRARFQRLILPVGFLAGEIGTAELGLLFRIIRGFADGVSVGVDPSGFEPLTSSLQMRRSTN